MTQKQLAFLVNKKVSEINELIKGKRKMTIQWDYLLSQALHTPEKYWISQQIDYDYQQYLKMIEAEAVSTSVSPLEERASHRDEVQIAESSQV